MHYYKFNIGDYRKDTGHLSTLEHGIYRQLLDWYYLDEKPIPLETQWVARRLSLGSDALQSLENVLREFFAKTDAGYRQTRCDAIIADYHASAEKNAVNGRKGGRPKTQSVTSGMPNGTQAEPKQKATTNHEPLTTNHEPRDRASRASRRTRIPEDFWPDENGLAAATAKGCSVAVELGKFRDYHTAQGSTMADWQAAWRTWVGRIKQTAQAGETAYQRSMRERMEKFAPSVAAKAPGGPKPSMEVFDVAAKQLG